MNRTQFHCEKCKSGYTVSLDSRHAKTCRVCEAIAREAGVELDNPTVQDAIDKAVERAVAKAEARAKERYDAELAKERAKAAKLATDKPIKDVPADSK